MRFSETIQRWLRKPRAAEPAVGTTDGQFTNFQCNVCGAANAGIPVAGARNREFQSCRACMSSLRMRSLVHALSIELFGKSMILSDFPSDPSIAGLGMSDWEGYATTLARKFAYTNTFYHAEPKLDISEIPESMVGKYRFLISSDVFEHIPAFALEAAFENSRRLLAPGGIFILTVPFTKHGSTREHYPSLHDFRIETVAGRKILRNRTIDGIEETFDDLVFHGGEGMTLEMRKFSEPDLLCRLVDAGFREVRISDDRILEFGIDWPLDGDVPIVARA
jgi:SAM-dependent methyltransferase